MEITHLPFLNVIKDVTSKFNKIQNKDFVNNGEFAIIDQGANVVAGYTNDKSVITDLGYPVVVFGDHTRIIKYINYPFAIGADGVKVLSVETDKAYPLYVFYFLKFLKIPNAGYSRHYKFLKEKKIVLPKDIDDQKRIAKVLSQCETLIQKRKESIELLDKLVRSTFLEMFGDPVKNEKGWRTDSLSTFGNLKNGLNFSRNEIGYDYKYLGVGDFKDRWKFTNINSLKSITLNSILSEDYFLQNGDVVFVRSNGNKQLIGRCIVIYPGDKKVTFSGFCIRYRIVNNDINPIYLVNLFRNKNFRQKMLNNGRGANIQNISQELLNKLIIPIPPPELQKQFINIVEKVDTVKNRFKDSLQELENLYGSISQRAFNGELDLSKVDISDMKDSKKKAPEAVREDITEKQLEDLVDSFEHNLPTGEVPSNRETDISNMSIRQYLRMLDNEETEGIEFSFMNKDFFYQFILTKGFPTGFFEITDLEEYARRYFLEGTGFEFTYENWKTIIFRFIGAKQPIIQQLFDEETKTIKLKLTDEAFKV